MQPGDGNVVAGDNPDAGYDSRQAGAFDVRDVRGVVIRPATALVTVGPVSAAAGFMP
ncbi:hypothetical protein [Nonomuraea bangladeshensis]|uniref:hypothetical protein n=1 Tax=Nonomuraea bangladeshensis TaxID=404385 RepID=UPI003C2BACE7